MDFMDFHLRAQPFLIILVKYKNDSVCVKYKKDSIRVEYKKNL